MEVKKIIQLGNIRAEKENYKNPQTGRVYDSLGCSSTLNTCEGGDRQPKILEKIQVIVSSRGRNPNTPSLREKGMRCVQRLEEKKDGQSNTLARVEKDNYVLEKVLIVDDTWSKNFKEIPPVYFDIFPTLKAQNHGLNVLGVFKSTLKSLLGYSVLKNDILYIIRKLTPKECFRLMGYTDTSYTLASQVVSATQIYKQAGNAIVKQVLMALFLQMGVGDKTWNDMTE